MLIVLAHCFKFSYKCHKFERNKNYYDILKIQFGCSKSGIRVAYLSLAKKYHPDVNPK
jgi:preprotein translocase subunit Sec63